MIRIGLCSVTFRTLGVPAVIALCVETGLEAVEWGGDVHVPAGDLAAAARTRDLTRQAGLALASYGSYLRCGDPDPLVAEASATEVLDTAEALAAPRVRVWAGSLGSAAAGAADRRRVVDRLADLVDRARPRGIEIGLEFHGGTLTDSAASTLRLLAEVERPELSTYWQPPVGMPERDALASLEAVLHRTSSVHAFSWWPRGDRLPLADRAGLWTSALGILARSGRDHDVLLEFVPDDDPAALPREAETLRRLREQTPTAPPVPGSGP